MKIQKPYQASRVMPPILAGAWCVRMVHLDGRSAWTLCYCGSETVAKEIATAMNVMDAIEDAKKEASDES